VIHLITYSFLLAILAACRGFSYAQLRCDVAVRFVDIGGIVKQELPVVAMFFNRSG
jgi:hypothetical protein